MYYWQWLLLEKQVHNGTRNRKQCLFFSEEEHVDYNCNHCQLQSMFTRSRDKAMKNWFPVLHSLEKTDARRDLFWLKSKMSLSIYLNKQDVALFDTCFFIFFYRKIITERQDAHKSHWLSTYKMLPCLLINSSRKFLILQRKGPI